MNIYGLDSEVIDKDAVERTAERFREQQIVLPTFGQLANPATAPSALQAMLGGVDKNAASPANLWRIHWYNTPEGRLGEVPEHVVLPRELTGVDAPIVVAFGDRFPMIGAHKVLAAYACLAPRLVTGTFDPTRHRAIWPSTGNYCRGGVAVSRLMGCRGVAVLPEGMSRERFDWLERWVVDGSDIIKTSGTESNVKEIYDKCHELAQDPDNVILNQFCEFGNHIVHRLATGSALERVVEHLSANKPDLKVRAFVSATGSAGTIGAGDHLKEQLRLAHRRRRGARVPDLAVQRLRRAQHPGHRRQARAPDPQRDGNRRRRRHLGQGHGLAERARQHRRGPQLPRQPRRVERTCSAPSPPSACRAGATFLRRSNSPSASISARTTSSSQSPPTVPPCTRASLPTPSSATGRTASARLSAAQVYGEHLLGAAEDHLLECTDIDRNRIFNLGYYTWVEQQGTSIEEFEARRDQSFWRSLLDIVPVWDDLIGELNARSGASS